ncbi:MAG: acyl-CoA dehydrogenase family protein [Pseudomonadota bacterium]|jgi:acyl-CoA dehydrogenase
MSDTDSVILDTATRMFADLSTPEAINAAEKGAWPAALWQAIEAAGLHLTWVPEASGGAGAELLDGFAVIKAAGAAAVPVPLAETLFAGWLLGRAGLQVPEGPLTVARGRQRLESGRVSGAALAVPHARHAAHILVLAAGEGGLHLAALAPADCTLRPGQSLAGEPWDAVEFSAVRPGLCAPIAAVDERALDAMGALIRTVQAAGALETALELTIQYAGERVQFGRPIGRFQAVQHMIADFAGEVAALSAAADAAAEAVAAAGGAIDADAWVEIAAAKTRLGRAASNGPAVAHQVHGAMGFTYEHRLHHFTRRLWAWRDEFGTETHWARCLGAAVFDWGPDQLWPKITAVTDK